MKTGRYLTLKKIFREYNQNKRKIQENDFPYISGIDYTKPRVTPDKTQNRQESIMVSNLDKKNELENYVRLVDEVIRWFTIEGYGRERYIQFRLINGLSEFVACEKIGITERTGRRWKRDIFEKSEILGEDVGVF